jgi:hypothetical protein
MQSVSLPSATKVMKCIRNISLVAVLLLSMAGCGDKSKEKKIEGLEKQVYVLTVLVAVACVGGIALWVSGAAMGSRARKSAEKHRTKNEEQ